MVEQEDALVIEAVLREEMPEQCAGVGRANVRDISRTGGKIRLVSPEGGSWLDLAPTMAVLAAAAAIISHGLTVIKNLSDRKTKEKPEIIIEVKLTLPKEVMSKLDAETVERLIQNLVKRS